MEFGHFVDSICEETSSGYEGGRDEREIEVHEGELRVRCDRRGSNVFKEAQSECDQVKTKDCDMSVKPHGDYTSLINGLPCSTFVEVGMRAVSGQ